MRSLSLLPIVAALCVAGAALPPSTEAQTAGPVAGLLVMAHGGTPEWNASVSDAVAPLRSEMPTALALGMADPVTMQAAMDSLANLGVTRVAVVRVFMSGESFRHQTEYLLGLRRDPPATPMLMHGNGHGSGPGDGAGSLQPLVHDAEVIMSGEGLMEAWATPVIMVDRAVALSRNPAGESVVLVAHGMGAEGADDRVLAEMESTAAEIRARGFRAVRAFTLREDWEEARARAEVEIRNAVEELGARGDRVLALPFRLSGFGPYAEVLEGLEYEAGDGLLPHPLITEWIRQSARELLNQPRAAG